MKRGKEVVQDVIEDVELFHQFLVAVIPGLKKWFSKRSKKGVREAAEELLSTLDTQFAEAREAIERKHDSGQG